MWVVLNQYKTRRITVIDTSNKCLWRRGIVYSLKQKTKALKITTNSESEKFERNIDRSNGMIGCR